jgi:cyclophilin family peptidyl-prolyl cis-trans isomerase
MAMTNDRSAEVRFWAIRALSAPVVAKSSVALDTAAARLRDALGDADRRVRTEAVRALVTYDDDASVAAIVKALSDPDMWIAVSAAESMGRFSARASSVVPALVQASAAGRPLALRIAALAPLTSLSPEAARPLADALAETDNATARTAAAAARRQMDAAAARATGARGTGAQGAGGGRGAGRGNAPATPALTARTDADYRDLVTKYVLPAWNGAPLPRVRFETSRGAIDVELNAGDAPFAVEYLMAIAASGEIAGSEFGRVVPNFVAQENAIRPSGRVRDEVNRHGLRRGTLSWASAGLDTGRPGYTFGSTPQPHNEGGFTALGQIVAGLDVVDRLELGDRILSVRVIR